MQRLLCETQCGSVAAADVSRHTPADRRIPALLAPLCRGESHSAMHQQIYSVTLRLSHFAMLARCAGHPDPELPLRCFRGFDGRFNAGGDYTYVSVQGTHATRRFRGVVCTESQPAAAADQDCAVRQRGVLCASQVRCSCSFAGSRCHFEQIHSMRLVITAKFIRLFIVVQRFWSRHGGWETTTPNRGRVDERLGGALRETLAAEPSADVVFALGCLLISSLARYGISWSFWTPPEHLLSSPGLFHTRQVDRWCIRLQRANGRTWLHAKMGRRTRSHSAPIPPWQATGVILFQLGNSLAYPCVL